MAELPAERSSFSLLSPGSCRAARPPGSPCTPGLPTSGLSPGPALSPGLLPRGASRNRAPQRGQIETLRSPTILVPAAARPHGEPGGGCSQAAPCDPRAPPGAVPTCVH